MDLYGIVDVVRCSSGGPCLTMPHKPSAETGVARKSNKGSTTTNTYLNWATISPHKLHLLPEQQNADIYFFSITFPILQTAKLLCICSHVSSLWLLWHIFFDTHAGVTEESHPWYFRKGIMWTHFLSVSQWESGHFLILVQLHGWWKAVRFFKRLHTNN